MRRELDLSQRDLADLVGMPDCCCPIECERWCVQECPGQCEPIGLWGYSRYSDPAA